MVYRLNSFEKRLVEAAEAGEICVFNDISDDVAILRGPVLRAILIGVTVDLGGEIRPVRLTGTGLRAVGGRIEGAFDLSNARSIEGGALAYIELRDCFFEVRFTVSQARLTGLCIASSNLSHLCGHEVVIEGGLDVSGLTTAETENFSGAQGKGLCWVDCHGAQIGAAVEAGSAQLVAPPARDNRSAGNVFARYALDLGHAKIDGSLRLMPDFTAIGGVSVYLSTIDGHIHAKGSHLIKEEGSAIYAGNAIIRGRVDFCSANKPDADTVLFLCDGDVNLNAAKIGSNLDMDGASINGGLTAINAQIGRTVYLRPLDGKKAGLDESLQFTILGEVIFYGAKIAANLDMRGADLARGLFAANAEIGGGVYLSTFDGKKAGLNESLRFTSVGEVTFYDSKIGSNLSMEGADLGSRLDCKNAEIGGNVFFITIDGKKAGLNESLPFTAMGNVRLYGAMIAGNLSIRGAILASELNAYGSKIGGSLFAHRRSGKKAGKPHVFVTTVGKRTNFINSRIGRDLWMGGARLKGGFSARGGEIGGKVHLPRFWMYGFIGQRFDYLKAASLLLLVYAGAWTIGGFGAGIATHGLVRQDLSLPFADKLLPDFKPITFSAAPVMVLDTGTVNIAERASPTQEQPCGTAIEPALYALDVFVPLLDLRQEARCAVSSKPEAAPWRWAMSIYAILGWILTSVLILTLSGIRYAKREGASGPD
jgi:hypothetical protein